MLSNRSRQIFVTLYLGATLIGIAVIFLIARHMEEKAASCILTDITSDACSLQDSGQLWRTIMAVFAGAPIMCALQWAVLGVALYRTRYKDKWDALDHFVGLTAVTSLLTLVVYLGTAILSIWQPVV